MIQFVYTNKKKVRQIKDTLLVKQLKENSNYYEYYNTVSNISSLKKLSSNSLSNLTPHRAYVFFHYSHPTLLQRIQNLKLK